MSWPVTRWIRYEPKAKYRRSRPLCHNWGFVCAWRGSIAYVKAWQHYPRTHVGHRRACTPVLLIGVSEKPACIQDARRLSAYMAHLPERMCSVSLNLYVHYIREADQIFSILNFQNAGRKEITPDASVCVGISCYRDARVPSLSSWTLSSVCVLRSLRCWQNSTKRCSNVRVLLMLDAETVESWESQWEISPQMLKMWFQCRDNDSRVMIFCHQTHHLLHSCV